MCGNIWDNISPIEGSSHVLINSGTSLHLGTSHATTLSNAGRSLHLLDVNNTTLSSATDDLHNYSDSDSESVPSENSDWNWEISSISIDSSDVVSSVEYDPANEFTHWLDEISSPAPVVRLDI